MNGRRSPEDGWSWWYLLFIVQVVAVIWPPFYNKIEPTLGGMPFFYWYQLLWVIIGAILTAIVYFVTEAQSRRGAEER
jgi:Na+/melibiose symporter-like transporter